MRFFSSTPRIVIGENSSVPDMSVFLVRTPFSRQRAGRCLLFRFYCLVAVSVFGAVLISVLGFGLACAALVAALSTAVLSVVLAAALSLRMVPQGSALFCSGMLPSDLL